MAFTKAFNLPRPFGLLFTCLALVSFISASGQDSHVGIKGGINLSSLRNRGLSNPRDLSRSGMHFEILLETRVNNHLTYQSTGFAWSPAGEKQTGFQRFHTPQHLVQNFPPGQAPAYVFGNVNTEKKLSYIFGTQVFRFSLTDDKYRFLRPYIAPGFYTAYLISAKSHVSGYTMVYEDSGQTQPLTNAAISLDETEDIKASLHKFNFGVTAAAGLIIDVKDFRLYFEGGAYYGLVNINKQKEAGKNYIQNVHAKAGVAYNIGKVFPFLIKKQNGKDY